jgi:uncharacterized protein YidB (DUF937 family)
MGLSDVLGGMVGGLSGQNQAGGAGGGIDLSNLAGFAEKLLPSVVQMLQGSGAGATGSAGGLGALVEAFQRNGLGDVVSSWIGTGQNLPVSADQLQQVLGNGTLGQLAAQAGISQDSIASVLSGVLPHVVDRLTPNGQIPEGDLTAQSGTLLDSLGLSPKG